MSTTPFPLPFNIPPTAPQTPVPSSLWNTPMQEDREVPDAGYPLRPLPNGQAAPGGPSSPVSVGSYSSFDDILSPSFVDNMALRLFLSDHQTQELHVIRMVGTSLGGGLPLADLATRICIAAAVFASENRIAARQKSSTDESVGNLAGLFKDLAIRLDDTFQITKQQSTNIRLVVKDLIYEPTRTSFKTLYIDVEAKIRRQPETYQMGNVFGHPAREVKFTAFVKRVASNIRNGFRLDIKKAVLPGTKCMSLETFTLKMAIKYRMGSIADKLQQGYTIHNVLLRRFAWENKELLDVGEDEGEEQSDDDRHDEDVLEDASRKRKRTSKSRPRQQGRIPNGQDFWARIDDWFEGEIEKRGKDFTEPLWKSYIDESIRLDKSRLTTSRSKSQVPSSLLPTTEWGAPSSSGQSSAADLLTPQPTPAATSATSMAPHVQFSTNSIQSLLMSAQASKGSVAGTLGLTPV
ncbi:hypothetical protein NLJ89_g5211 [Agrocybe chaxingu]|uniref:Uncharacterized protein n=1 Tax=Agrocybe chaxingu TaxID=84603 RepID=A0A9W8MXE7_9AGAR|nr:hypothetical protein NLJ89_g5211 [Agrocybe chaxingu]